MLQLPMLKGVDMQNQSLNTEERIFLLQLARDTIARALNEEREDSLELTMVSPRLQMPGASFVTLHTRLGLLRGCIGSLQAHRSLVEDVRHNALAAAFEDPRFPPLGTRELSDIVIEISVLSTPQSLAYTGADDLMQKLRPRIDGVVLERGWHRATFLPQVWEQLPSTREFLGNLCYKAGLPAEAWREADVKISTYQVEEFSEND
jgi:AmmeMemoRadiSam system protein A